MSSHTTDDSQSTSRRHHVKKFCSAMKVVNQLNIYIRDIIRRYNVARDNLNPAYISLLHRRLTTIEAVRSLYLEYARTKMGVSDEESSGTGLIGIEDLSVSGDSSFTDTEDRDYFTDTDDRDCCDDDSDTEDGVCSGVASGFECCHTKNLDTEDVKCHKDDTADDRRQRANFRNSLDTEGEESLVQTMQIQSKFSKPVKTDSSEDLVRDIILDTSSLPATGLGDSVKDTPNPVLRPTCSVTIGNVSVVSDEMLPEVCEGVLWHVQDQLESTTVVSDQGEVTESDLSDDEMDILSILDITHKRM